MTITPEGTAVFTVYEVYPNDVTTMIHAGNGPIQDPIYIWDGLFQEIDIATDTLVFQWRASDHYALTDAYVDLQDDSGTKDNPFDWFHINSVQKDESGNYLISSRYTHSIAYIQGITGQVLWVLGGKRNHFVDLSNGQATNFAWQHDARFQSRSDFPRLSNEMLWHEDKVKIGEQVYAIQLISLFDNAAEDFIGSRDSSRGLLLELIYPIEPVDRFRNHQYTARLLHSFDHPEAVLSTSQGSLQIVPSKQGLDATVLVGYGVNALFTEYASNGTVLCDVRFATKSSWGQADVQSYRTSKSEWVGYPAEPLSAVMSINGISVSWNGATEVRSWVLQDSSYPAWGWSDVSTIEKHGFENVIELDKNSSRRYWRVAAADMDGKILGVSNVTDLSPFMVCSFLLRICLLSDDDRL